MTAGAGLDFGFGSLTTKPRSIMGRTDWKLTERETKAIDSQAGRIAYQDAKIAGESETAARKAAVSAWVEAEAERMTDRAVAITADRRRRRFGEGS